MALAGVALRVVVRDRVRDGALAGKERGRGSRLGGVLGVVVAATGRQPGGVKLRGVNTPGASASSLTKSRRSGPKGRQARLR